MLKYCLFASVFYLPLLANAGIASILPEFFIEVESFTYSPAIPVKQLKNDMRGPAVSKGDYALSSNRVETGFQTEYFTFSIVERIEFYSEFTNDTANIIQKQRNNIIDDDNTRYHVDLYGFYIEARGAKLQLPVISRPEFGVSAALTYYEASEMQQGILKGTIYNSENIAGSLDLDYSYSNDVFFNREPRDAKGYGYSFDIEGWWDLDELTRFTFSVRDLKSRIGWRNQQHTTSSATSETVRYDSNGRINARPVVEWFESERTVYQELPRHFKLSATRLLNDQWAVGAVYERYESINILTFEGSYLLGSAHRIAANISPGLGSLGVRYHSKLAYFGISCDQLQWQEMHNLNFSMGLNLPLKF